MTTKEIVSKIESLKMDAEKYDGIYFYKDDNGDYTYMILQLERESDKNFELTDMGYKYLTIFTHDAEEVVKAEINESIMGDPLRIASNYIKAKCEGIIVKKCQAGFDLIERLKDLVLARNAVANV